MGISLLQRNMDFIKETFGAFYSNLTSPEFYMPDIRLTELPSPDGAEDGAGGNVYVSNGTGVRCALHSLYSTEREMDRLFEPLTGEDNQVIVIFGLGYGHCIDYIRRKRVKYKRLVIFEPCTNIIMDVLGKRPVLELLGMKELFLHLLKTPNDMARYLLDETLASRTVRILCHLSYRSLFSETYDEVLRAFKSARIGNDSSINTVVSLSKSWNTNQLRSIRGSDASAALLAGKFNGVPGIVASAGPSLEKQFGLLEEIGDRAFIIAPGSSIRILNRRGVDVHAAASIDASQIQAEFFENYRQKNLLIASYRLHPDVYKVFPGKIFRTVLSSEYLTQYYFDWLEEKPMYISDHPSVSGAAIDMLHLMGCNPIILIGQDLCFHEERTYADAEKGTLKQWERESLMPDVDMYGEKVFTNIGYKAMQHDFETTNLRIRDSVEILNATEGGLNIPGIENVRFCDVFDKYIKERASDVGRRVRAVYAEAGEVDFGNDVKTLSDENELADDIAVGVADDGSRGSFVEGVGGKAYNDFYIHLINACNDTQALINEKEARFTQLAKLVKRGVSKNRLNAEVQNIREYNSKLNAVQFFKKVVMPNIDSALTYIRASGKYMADSGDDWEGAAMFESRLDAYALEFVNLVKALVLREMVSETD